MTDIFDSRERSRIMSRIGGKDTTPEIRVRNLLHSLGYRFRLHVKALPGTPDIVLPGRRVAIFVHGCFWHSHPGCRRATIPATNVEFWLNKLDAARRRDARSKVQLEELGYKVATIWECETKKKDVLLEVVLNIFRE